MTVAPERIEVVDAQIHLLDPRHCQDSANEGGGSEDEGPSTPTGARRGQVLIKPVPAAEMVTAMAAAGVDAALAMTSSFYGWDNTYALEAAERFPDSFRVVGLLDPYAADIEDQVAAWSALDKAVGMRIVIASPLHRSAFDEGLMNRYLDAATRHQVPVCIFASDHLPAAAAIARRFPELQLVIDHFGLAVRLAGDPPVEVYRRLAQVLELAQYPNIALKITGGPCLSTESFPFRDLDPLLDQLVACFGPQRLMWGTDWVRVPNASYAEGVRYLLESDRINYSDKMWIMGQALRSVFGWPTSLVEPVR